MSDFICYAAVGLFCIYSARYLYREWHRNAPKQITDYERWNRHGQN